MKNLTISTAALAEAARRLPSPRDYFAGVTSPAPVVPDHLLMFARRHSRELGGVPHAHHRFVLVAAVVGRGDVIVDQVAHSLEPGRAVLVFPFQFHHYLFEQPGAVSWVFTTFELPSDAPLTALRDRTLALTAHVLADLTRAASCFVRPTRRAAADEARLGVALALAALLGSVPGAPRLVRQPSRESELLERVGRFVFAHLERPISVGMLARAVGSSPTHLRQQLRARYGLSPHGYVRQVKMLQAMRLLRTTDRRISEVAEALGYSSLFAFSRAFKLETGQNPRGYRRQHRA